MKNIIFKTLLTLIVFCTVYSCSQTEYCMFSSFRTSEQVTENVGKTPITCFHTMDVKKYINWCLYLKNTGENPLTDVSVLVSPDGKAWAPLVWTSCDYTMPGETCVYKEEKSTWSYIKATCAASDAERTSVAVWCSGNNGCCCNSCEDK